MNAETPHTVHGRLLEAVHISGYTFERACGELEWLLTEGRWRQVGSGYDDIHAFMSTLGFSEFKHAVEQRRKIAKQLQDLEANQRATAKMLGVSQATVSRDLSDSNESRKSRKSAEIAQPSDDLDSNESRAWFQADADPTREAKRVTRNEERLQERAARARPTPPAVEGCYRLIVADPPWQYEHVETESRAIENQYPTMTLDEICALEVPAADDCVLFLWATSPKLAEAMLVIDTWGFDYRTCAVWDKEVIGMGYYFRQQHELLLVAVRGSMPVPEPSARVSSVIRARRGRHSAKPGAAYTLLEQMYPDFGAEDRVELFARAPRKGWAAWGNDPAVA
jgi:N6-adenosine-specific RNA methylase IME4